MKSLYAFYEKKRVGILTKNDDDIYSFEYEQSWIDDSNSFPISLSMPLEQKKFGNKTTLSFFENLLPEGDVRKELETAHKINGVFEFLAEFGKDCAGAIVLSPLPDYQPFSTPADLTQVDIESVFEAIDKNLSVAQVISETNPGYLSLAGAQDKFPAVFKGGKFFLPKNGYPTTHIVKVPIWRQGVKESIYNEYFCMELARAIGLEIPKCEVIDGKHPLFVIERYDRAQEGDTVRRVHQQDLCQAQGYPSEYKYEIKGGPTLQQNYEFITANTSRTLRLKNLEGFLNWICFNLIIGNNDSHSKNISLLLFQHRRYSIAPFYDLMCTAIYPQVKKEFSFLIGDRDEFSKIGKTQINKLEEQLDLKRDAFRARLKAMSEAITSEYRKLGMQIQEHIPSAKIIHRINDLIDERIKSLKFQGAIH